MLPIKHWTTFTGLYVKFQKAEPSRTMCFKSILTTLSVASNGRQLHQWIMNCKERSKSPNPNMVYYSCRDKGKYWNPSVRIVGPVRDLIPAPLGQESEALSTQSRRSVKQKSLCVPPASCLAYTSILKKGAVLSTESPVKFFRNTV
jgi:hypothetical protein